MTVTVERSRRSWVRAEDAEDAPLCDCHDVPKQWHADKRLKAGGYWRCRVKHRANSLKWNRENPEVVRENVQRWQEDNADLVAEYQRDYQSRMWPKWQQEFLEWLAPIKGDTCSECGGKFPQHKLHFHHVDPSTKLFEIGNAAKRNRESVLAEIKKCIVVCVSCHSRIEPRCKKKT